jgi:hypothetical protein
VLRIKSRTSLPLLKRIREELGLELTLMNGTLRAEIPNAHQMVPQLIDRFGSEIDSVTVGKPTLEDAFIHQTGHEL